MKAAPVLPRAVAPPPASPWECRTLALILAVAAVLRLWHLETPSQWFDEILVSMTAKYPVETIVRRALEQDFHPPLFYLLAKLSMAAGVSDMALRLPPALCGLAGVWAAWRLAREAGPPGAGLACAAFAAVLPWHVLLSRQVRPYSIVFLCSCLALTFLIRAVRDGRRRDVMLAGLWLWPMVLVHFSALLAVFGAGCVLLCAALAGRVRWWDLLLFGLVCAGAVAAVAPFLLAGLGHEKDVTGAMARWDVLLLCLKRLFQLLLREEYLTPRAGLACLAGFGLARLLARGRVAGLVGLGWVAFPVLALVAAGYSTYFNPWHLMFLLPAGTLWLGTAVSRGDGRAGGWVGLGICLLGLGYLLGPWRGFYYDEGSHQGEYKPLARAVLVRSRPDEVTLVASMSFSNALNFYLDQYAAPNPLRAQAVAPGTADITARVVSNGDLGRLGSMAPPPAVHRFGAPGAGSVLEHALELRWAIPRHPRQDIGALPWKIHVTSEPRTFYGRLWALENLTCLADIGFAMIPTANDIPGAAQFRFDNRAGDGPQRITVHFGYDNAKRGNTFRVRSRFDDEDWITGFESLGPDQRSHDKLVLTRAAPYRTLDVRFELVCSTASPAFPGENLYNLRFFDFKVEAERAPERAD